MHHMALSRHFRSSNVKDARAHSSGVDMSTPLADDYDQFQASVPHYLELQSKVGYLVAAAANAAPQPLKIVEAGTGTGATSRSILAAHGALRLVSVDPDEGMLGQASRNLSNCKDRVEFVRRDILGYLQDLPSNALDGFVSAYTLHNIEPVYRDELVPEIARVLKDGAIYINADKIARDDERSHIDDLRKQIDAFKIYDRMGRPDLRSYWTQHYMEDEARRIVETSHLQQLRSTGFDDARIVWRKGMEAIVVAHKQVAAGKTGGK